MGELRSASRRPAGLREHQMGLIRGLFKPGFTIAEFIFTTATVAFLASMAAQEISLKRKSNNIVRVVKVTQMLNEALERYYIDHKGFDQLAALETLCDGGPRYLPPYICNRKCSLAKEPHYYELITTTEDSATVGIPIDSVGIARRLKDEITSLEMASLSEIIIFPAAINKLHIVLDYSYLEIDKEEDKPKEETKKEKRERLKKEKERARKLAAEKRKREAQQRKKEQAYIRKQRQLISKMKNDRRKFMKLYKRTKNKKDLLKIQKIDQQILLTEKALEARIKKTNEEKKRASEKAKSGWNNHRR